jgi:hypothetical protein
VLIEAQLSSGTWTNPEGRKVKLEDYAADWIAPRPGLRPRTVDLYRWLLHRHIVPYIGSVPVGKMSAAIGGNGGPSSWPMARRYQSRRRHTGYSAPS